MREGIDAPLCGGSNRRMDPRTGLPYFPNQTLLPFLLPKCQLHRFGEHYSHPPLNDTPPPFDTLLTS